MARLFQKINHLINGPEITIFHKFQKPPYGGGNQFLLALEKELARRNLDVGRNKIGNHTKICLFNAFHFDFDKLSRLHKQFNPKMIHRVDGPVSLYRGKEQGIDEKMSKLNQALADSTIFQSYYSLNTYQKLGLEFKNPTVIHNASDPEIFNRMNRIPQPDGSRKIKIVAMSWSSNIRKGASVYEHLDKYLDFSRFEFTFVGNCPYTFGNTTHIKPVPSSEVAHLLKNHDIYITASEHDPCSNALIEALTCGLPAAYLNSGGHPELVRGGGEGFVSTNDVLEAIEKIAQNYKKYQDAINIPSLQEAVDKYIGVFNS